MKGYTKLIGEKGNIHMENIPDQEEVEYPIKEDLWNTESNIVRYTVKNNLHKQIFYEFRFLSANGKGLNVARAIKLCGEKVQATGITSGFNGQLKIMNRALDYKENKNMVLK